MKVVVDDDVYYDHGGRPKLEGGTENKGVWTKERIGMTAEVLMATLCTSHWERSVSSPCARVETAGAAARNESARKC